MPSRFATAVAFAFVLLAVAGAAHALEPDGDKCNDNDVLKPNPTTTTPRNLLVVGKCKITTPGVYKYDHIWIYSPNPGGASLTISDATVDIYASSILVENNGALIAGEGTPIGTGTNPTTKKRNVLTFHIYSKDQGIQHGKGVPCVQPICGIPRLTVWDTNGSIKVPLPGGAPNDFFYQYDAMPSDGGDPSAYFGYKMIGVSYGGVISLAGAKGATYGTLPASSSGMSWARLAANANASTVTLDRDVNWEVGDEIVVTTTDYLPGHSEQRTITAISGRTLTVSPALTYAHNGAKFELPAPVPTQLGLDSQVETRAAVALLTRSIRVVSEGDTVADRLPAASFFGAHMIFRQGAAKVQIQGVEFKQMGQGGRLGHYPVHFHHMRSPPPNTYVKDSSVNESMTRWYVIHGTHNVTLARNVGWKSIGHGYYLEDGTEINNSLYSNIGIYARPAIQNATVNPRSVPGILAAQTANGLSKLDPNAYRTEYVPFYSDYDHPSIFWIMNTWNDFEGNMAVGAGACGVCFWMLPGANSGHSRHLKWEGYASIQGDPTHMNPTARAGLTPIKRFTGNYCSTAFMSLNTTGNTAPCIGIGAQNVPNPDTPLAASVVNPLAPKPCDQSNPHTDPNNPDSPYEPFACAAEANAGADSYYPKIGGGGRFPTQCPDETQDCSSVPQCADGHLEGCMVSVIDHYVSSFHWAETNFAAIWLRPQWYLYQYSVLTDIINGGITFVTGGGYTSADVVPGHWALAYKNVFIGQTQDGNPFSSIASPINPQGGLACDGPSGNHCLVANQSVSFSKGNFGINQRMFNIYDGPAYQEANAYLKIKPFEITDCKPGQGGGLSNCGSSKFLAGPITGLPQAGGKCYMPNAAIGWKQPNGFYYPPAFHSRNLYFGDEVEIRHYVTQPLFDPDTYITNLKGVQGRYCNWTSDMFNNWTDVDRQTELNDDDGSLTGYINTISVNEDAFFSAPKEGFECASDLTAKTSPYDYVTTVVYPRCGLTKDCPLAQSPFEPSNPLAKISTWNADCTNQTCFGVPMYRQLWTGSEMKTPPTNAPAIRLAGQATFQRSSLTPNNASYYIDTTPGVVTQATKSKPQRTLLNVFQANQTYYVFLLFAKPATTQTYSIYVGKDFKVASDFFAVQVDVKPGTPVYTKLATLPSTWPTPTLSPDGILTVTMNMGFPEFKTNYDSELNGKCGPATFCTGDATSCGCKAGDPFCSAAVCKWAVADLDCPKDGCYGFAFTLPGTFTNDVAVKRPSPACFTNTPTTWGVPWNPATQGVAGNRCYNAPKSPDNFCN